MIYYTSDKQFKLNEDIAYNIANDIDANEISNKVSSKHLESKNIKVEIESTFDDQNKIINRSKILHRESDELSQVSQHMSQEIDRSRKSSYK